MEYGDDRMNMPDFLPPPDGEHAFPFTPEMVRTITRLFAEVAQPEMCVTQDELTRWFDIIRRGNIDIEDLERMDSAIEETDHGFITLDITFRQVSKVTIASGYKKQQRRKDKRHISR